MLSTLPADLILRNEVLDLPPFSAAVCSQLANARYWHIYSKQYVKNGWSMVSRMVERSPIQELQISDNQYSAILQEIAPIQLPNLLSLSLISNQIVSIEAFVFLQAPKLQNLYLNRNCIRTVAPLRKAHLPCLKFIVINDNPIIDCETLAHSHFPNIECLVLENWSESNAICQDSNKLLKFETQKFKFLGMKSSERIRRDVSVRQILARCKGVQVNRQGDQ